MGAEVETKDLVSGEGPGAQVAVPGVVAVFSSDHPLLVAYALDGSLPLGRDDARGITDDRVSREHAVLTYKRGRWTITDAGSRNGTFVDGERITGTRELESWRTLRLAYTVYVNVDDVRPFRDGAVVDDGERVVGPTFAATLAQVRRGAGTPLLITGETGTGKELVARAAHDAAGGGAFVSVNCAAIPEGVAERLLFGSTRGAFTGATDAEGYFAAADGGTLFLDEIAELDPAVQSKLLRVLETREVTPLGAARARTVTTRFCFASSRSLRAAMSDSDFRPDLYYRIAQLEVRVPALRERPEEIPWLVAHELARSPGAPKAHARFVEECLLRPWPGNVRELRAAVRAAALKADGLVRPEHLDAEAGRALSRETRAVARPQDVTREQIVGAMAAEHGNLTAVAKALGLHRSQLYRLLDKYGIER